MVVEKPPGSNVMAAIPWPTPAGESGVRVCKVTTPLTVVPTAASVTATHAENSEVLPGTSVAVAVMARPKATLTGRSSENTPLLSIKAVATWAEPKNVSPSPWPDGSQAGLEKNRRMKKELQMKSRKRLKILIRSRINQTMKRRKVNPLMLQRILMKRGLPKRQKKTLSLMTMQRKKDSLFRA